MVKKVVSELWVEIIDYSIIEKNIGGNFWVLKKVLMRYLGTKKVTQKISKSCFS